MVFLQRYISQQLLRLRTIWFDIWTALEILFSLALRRFSLSPLLHSWKWRQSWPIFEKMRFRVRHIFVNLTPFHSPICLISTYYIWFERELIGECSFLYLELVRPTVRTLLSENWTPVEKNDQESTFFKGFMNNYVGSTLDPVFKF